MTKPTVMELEGFGDWKDYDNVPGAVRLAALLIAFQGEIKRADFVKMLIASGVKRATEKARRAILDLEKEKLVIRKGSYHVLALDIAGLADFIAWFIDDSYQDRIDAKRK
jgi:hypothetical protein